MKILIIGELYSSNLGDGVICENVKNIVEKYYDGKNLQIYLADISCRQGFTEENKERKTKASKNYIRNILYKSEYITYKIQEIKKKKKIKEICKSHYDVAIFAGGHLIMSYFTLQIYNFVKYLSKNGTKIIFNACGVGEIKSPILLYKIRKTLRNERIVQITSRDNVEKLKIKYLDQSNKIPVSKTYDPAIYTNETYGITKDETSKVVGLGIMNVKDIPREKMLIFWKQIIDHLEKEGYRWQLFCNGSQADYELACKCLEMLGLPNIKKYIADKPLTPKELVETIAKYNSIISFRLHSHIIAYSLEIPTIAIVWDEKVKFFFRDLGMEDRCFDINQDTVEIIDKLLETKKIEYKKEIKTKQKEVIKQNILKNLKI